ncbi:hypothetical protein K438DRAFT_1771778 [Mycena galopus ATCC 62051]|nr:hypothetical protein K438DRAFT_1771778 [Mycena galopus ATCC 62051]
MPKKLSLPKHYLYGSTKRTSKAGRAAKIENVGILAFIILPIHVEYSLVVFQTLIHHWKLLRDKLGQTTRRSHFPLTLFQHISLLQYTMPPMHTQSLSAHELRRRKQLAAITHIHNPIHQALAHIAQPWYKDFRGDFLRIYVDALEIKSGFSIHTLRRQFEYHHTCRNVEFLWLYRYKSDSMKLLERLVHLTLRALGTTIDCYPCPSCGVKHWEFYSYLATGGIEGLCAIIEFWLGVLGQTVERSDYIDLGNPPRRARRVAPTWLPSQTVRLTENENDSW